MVQKEKIASDYKDQSRQYFNFIEPLITLAKKDSYFFRF